MQAPSNNDVVFTWGNPTGNQSVLRVRKLEKVDLRIYARVGETMLHPGRAHSGSPSVLLWANAVTAILVSVGLVVWALGFGNYVYYHGSVSTSTILDALGILLGSWLLSVVCVIVWRQSHPFRLWLVVPVPTLLALAYLTVVEPTATWGSREVQIRGQTAEYQFVPIDGHPFGLAVGSDVVWITDTEWEEVVAIDPVQMKVDGEPISVGENPVDLELDPHGLWVATTDGVTVQRIDPTTRRIVATIPVSPWPQDLAIGDGSIWVASTDWPQDPPRDRQGGITRIDPETNRVIATIRFDGGATGVAVGNGGVWAANSNQGSVVRIDPTTNHVVANIPIGAFRIASGNGSIWVTDRVKGSVSRIDPLTNQVVATIPLGTRPAGMTVDGNHVWIATSGDSKLWCVDAQTNQLVGPPIEVGRGSAAPTNIRVANGTIWITNQYGSLQRFTLVAR